MYVKRDCVNKEVTEREDTAWPSGKLIRLSEQDNRQVVELIVSWEEKRVLGVIKPKRKKPPLQLRKRAIKPATSWYADTVKIIVKTTHHTHSPLCVNPATGIWR